MKDPAGTAFAIHLRTNDSLLTINVDMNDFNFQNFSAITEKLKENKKTFKRGLINRHKKNIEELKVCAKVRLLDLNLISCQMEETKLIELKGELTNKTEQRIAAETNAHEAISKMEQVEAHSQQYAKQLEESLEEARKQIVASTNKSQAIASQTATVKSDKEQR